MSLPAGPAEVTAEWLAAALRESGVLAGDADVTAAKAEVIGEGVGVLGQLARFGVTYSAETTAPASVIGKFPGAAEENRALANMFRFYEREVNFYERIAGTMELRAPRRYYSQFDEDTRGFVLLIEDMAPVDCGDQLAGCSTEEAATAVLSMAPFHAAWWGKVDTPELDWIPYVNDQVQQFAAMAYNNGWENFASNFGERLTPGELAMAERFRTKILGVQDALQDRPRTIVHGDLRYDNMFFDRDGEMTLCDWQIVQRGPAAYDIGYFMSQSLNPADRKTCEMDILRDYHASLEKHGVIDYSFDQLLDDYRLAAMYCLVYPVIVLGLLDTANERGGELGKAMLERSMATIQDLRCDEMISA